MRFFLGEYGNFDKFGYECAYKFKQKHSSARLIFITPYISSGVQIHSMQNRFDLILYPSLENIPPRYAISHRNKWMVEQADIVFAYVTHHYGGAYQMYHHAQKKGKKIYNIGLME